MATFNVTNTKSSGLGSLQQAILNANASAGKDLIRFTGGLFTDNIADTISLGGSSLLITDDLSIDGRGSNLLTVSGNYNFAQDNNISRVFEIANGITVDIEGLTIANGYATDTRGGGGVYNAGNLTLRNVTISNNFSGGQDSSGNNGGGIYNSNSGVLRLNNSTVTANYAGQVNAEGTFYAGDGGGIYNAGIVTLNNSAINGNSAGYYNDSYFPDNLGNGAGIYNTGTLTAKNSTINNNRGTGDGTGIYSTGTVTLNSSSVNGNESSNPYYNAFSGIVSNGSLTIKNSSVSNNRAIDVNGASSGIDSSGTLIISYSHIDNNQSYWSSGVIHSGILTVTNSSINYNSGRNSSGLIATGTSKIDKTTINGNYSYYDFSSAGLSLSGTATVNNSSISSNSSDYGRAGFSTRGNVTVTNSTISGNIGGFNLALGSIYSSGIYNSASGNLTVIRSTITGNSNPDGAANGTIVNYGTITIISSTISDNLAGLGGGILNYGTASVINTTINNNIAGIGGAINNSGTLTVVNSTISGNQSYSEGGGIYNSGTLTVSNSTIALNKSYYDEENTVSSGAGIYNAATGTATIKNSIIAGNNDGIPGAVNPDVFGNFISNGYNLIGNLDGSTGFNPSEQLQFSISQVIDTILRDNGGPVKTHALVYGSPAINSGNNADIPADIADLDRDGNTTEGIPFDQRGSGYRRILNGRVDIGAYEASVINGTAYPDNLQGTAANDLIAGLRGADMLTGGAGADSFVYTSLADSGDTITDFAVGTDKIVLQALWRSLDLSNLNFATAIAGGYLQLQTSGTDTSVLIDLDGTAGQRVALELVRLRNVSANALNDSRNFVF
ncbi:type I secretion C-terminal target domain-containing protein [Nostoc spongiaeforme FACHB-130]|uniref:Type I secretion C-terminal target domain-containing protein n=1 Tax=Nostoc spongiaeforme FACHB-130 TaxID=1357510 RepID=A0ABR8G0H4_9NOSO|nr:choice-of-anchor Q domain-containing protein [Nostoc spongiaeforme]MBD2596730.1 type I secretion C-terminal target domain-containing protein [Nostoc spongiaeforme FACHB-130]